MLVFINYITMHGVENININTFPVFLDISLSFSVYKKQFKTGGGSRNFYGPLEFLFFPHSPPPPKRIYHHHPHPQEYLPQTPPKTSLPKKNASNKIV